MKYMDTVHFLLLLKAKLTLILLNVTARRYIYGHTASFVLTEKNKN